jgi:uncharacterized protein (TIGR02246 family)
MDAAARRLVLIAMLMGLTPGLGRAAGGPPAATATAAVAEIEQLNRRFELAGMHMDNAEVMACYADDAVSLLPGMDGMVGKKVIAAWLDGMLGDLKGYRVTSNRMEMHDIRVSGDWASEWGTTAQTVQPPDGKPAIEAHGKILLVLHRETPGGWKIVQEMWNAAPAASAAAQPAH